LNLPSGPRISDDELMYVIDKIRKAAKH